MVKKMILLGAVVFLLAGCQPNISVNYGDSNANDNVNAVSNANVNAVANTNQAIVTPTLVSNLAGNIIDVRISDVVNSQGAVEVNKTSFTKDTAEIFTSSYVQGAEAGLVATAELVYLSTGDIVGPVSNPPADAGDLISNFSFTKPTNGWPAGNYNINVSLSNGQKKIAPFIVQ